MLIFLVSLCLGIFETEKNQVPLEDVTEIRPMPSLLSL